MDSQVPRDGKLLIDIVDDDWLAEKLPPEEVYVPLREFPEAEPDNGQAPDDTAREQEDKWCDNNLDRLATTSVVRDDRPALPNTHAPASRY
jgi:hypothetical protein